MRLQLLIILFYTSYSSQKNLIMYWSEKSEFNLLLEEILVKNLLPYKCVVVMSDHINEEIFERPWYKRFEGFVDFIIVHVEDHEDLLSPSENIKESLLRARNQGCQMYIIMISNALQVARLLRYGDRYRVLNTRSKFILLYDNRLFDRKILYLWKRIINVVFIRQYGGLKDDKKSIPWFEIVTVPFPAPITTILVPRRLDIWTQMKFRLGVELFRDKTFDLKTQTLKVAAFAHIPGTAKVSLEENTVRAVMRNGTLSFSGTEVEILQTVAKAMNFKCAIYEPEDADLELWGGKRTGLIGEMVASRADVALGDLYYTPFVLDLMDLTVPYNTECLTFLTPESLSDNSWKTLTLPFRPLMWAAVFICLLISAAAFYFLAHFHNYVKIHIEKDKMKEENKKKTIITLSLMEKLNPDKKYMMMMEKLNPPKEEGQARGLYQFTEPFNSVLYTYSMLLLVSLPKLPTGWSLRMLTGWYWLYCLLLVVAYRASMTAILARPMPKVTIDTLQELVASKLKCGGWGEMNRDFFQTSIDPLIKTIGDNFEMISDSDAAVDRVAEGSFAFYENSYFLKETIVKRQFRYQTARSNLANNSLEARDIAREDRNLHIMTDCLIKMPISIGLQKNSPIKPRVDKLMRNVLEAGLIKKWLNDVMTVTLNAEVEAVNTGQKAIMNLQKFYGAIIALFIGYGLSSAALIIELAYFRFVIKRNPNYNKYSRRIEVKKAV